MSYKKCIALLVVTSICASAFCPPISQASASNTSGYLEPIDVFDIEFAADPQISPDGKQVVYVRNFMDVMHDRRRSNLWIVDFDGSNHRPLTSGTNNDASPRWSSDGDRLLYVSSTDGSRQIHVRWMDSGQTAVLSRLTHAPSSIVWSPDGEHIAFAMHVPIADKPFADMPPKPEGAKWAEPARVIDRLLYRSDGRGYLRSGFTQLFVLPAEGGTPRQLTTGSFNHNTPPAWTPDSQALVFSANRNDDWEYDPVNSDIYEVNVSNGEIRTITKRQGPDNSPAVSPDGNLIAYTGFDDREQGYQVQNLYIMRRDGSDSRVVTGALDRSIQSPTWAADGRGVYFRYDDKGNTKIGYATLKGKHEIVAHDVGGTTLGRPYASGSFSVAKNGRFVFTRTSPERPADIVTGRKGSSKTNQLTNVNEDLLAHKRLGSVEEIWFDSSHDGRRVQGWVVKPPEFDPTKKYPLMLEIHGGPFANYGDRFSAEMQLYAAAGYVVLYTNPRGSTSYGGEFGNLIHHNYPGEDYDDLMSGVDAVIDAGYIDEENLFVTGGSGGGVLTSWIVGKTNRFRAAVSAKPVINWYSFVLTSDVYNIFYKYWFPGFPWDHPDHYLKRSPLSLVGNVETPTMLLTGDADYRTPMSETAQFYQALKLRRIDTALVQIPGASHGITARPSNLIKKVAHILKWFETYRVE